MCRIQVHTSVDKDEIEIHYKRNGKPTFVRGYYGCPRCFQSLMKKLMEHMETDRINRGLSLQILRQQDKKFKKSGCGCGG